MNTCEISLQPSEYAKSQAKKRGMDVVEYIHQERKKISDKDPRGKGYDEKGDIVLLEDFAVVGRNGITYKLHDESFDVYKKVIITASKDGLEREIVGYWIGNDLNLIRRKGVMDEFVNNFLDTSRLKKMESISRENGITDGIWLGCFYRNDKTLTMNDKLPDIASFKLYKGYFDDDVEEKRIWIEKKGLIAQINAGLDEASLENLRMIANFLVKKKDVPGDSSQGDDRI